MNVGYIGETDDNGEFDIFQQLEKNVFNKSAFCLSVLASVSPCTNRDRVRVRLLVDYFVCFSKLFSISVDGCMCILRQ